MSQRPPRDPQGRHVRIYCTLLDSLAWRVMGWSSRALFIDMRSSVNQSNNGNLSATLASLKHRGWKSAATLANALFELQALGFIAKTRGGGVEHGSKVCSLYRFTDLDMFDFPKQGLVHQKATHDYLQFATLADVEQAIQSAAVKRQENAARIAAKRAEAKARKKSTVQKLKRSSSETESVKAFDSSVSEADTRATVQKLKQRKVGTNRAGTIAAQRIPPLSRGDSVPSPSASETEHLYMLPPIGGEDAVQRGADPAVGKLRKTTTTALAKSAMLAVTTERPADSRREQGKGKGLKAAPRPAIAASDPIDDITRHADNAPAAFWDSELEEFRAVPQSTQRATLLAEPAETSA